MHNLLGDDEHEIGEGDGQRRFGQPVVAGPGDQLQQRSAAQESQNRAAKKGNQKLLLANEEVWLLSGDNHPKQHCEHDDCRGVIQKRFTLDEAR